MATAKQLGASDIHLEPTAAKMKVRFRVGGVMVDGGDIAAGLKESLVSKLKVMAGLDSTVYNLPQDGAFVAQGVQGRISTIPVLDGQSVVIRLFGVAKELEGLDGLGLSQTQRQALALLLKRTSGLLLITGPTGSGKTTTFYAALRQIDPQTNKIITVEDPVEQQLGGVVQVPVNESTGFATALRSILRHAPNVIGVGEIRDGHSAAMALQAALTGHLVVATLHADSVLGTLSRLRELGLNSKILAQVLVGVCSQRLVHMRQVGQGSCARALFELSGVSDQLASAIAQECSIAQCEEILKSEGFLSLVAVAEAAVAAGEISQELFMSEFVAVFD